MVPPPNKNVQFSSRLKLVSSKTGASERREGCCRDLHRTREQNTNGRESCESESSDGSSGSEEDQPAVLNARSVHWSWRADEAERRSDTAAGSGRASSCLPTPPNTTKCYQKPTLRCALLAILACCLALAASSLVAMHVFGRTGQGQEQEEEDQDIFSNVTTGGTRSKTRITRNLRDKKHKERRRPSLQIRSGASLSKPMGGSADEGMKMSNRTYSSSEQDQDEDDLDEEELGGDTTRSMAHFVPASFARKRGTRRATTPTSPLVSTAASTPARNTTVFREDGRHDAHVRRSGPQPRLHHFYSGPQKVSGEGSRHVDPEGRSTSGEGAVSGVQQDAENPESMAVARSTPAADAAPTLSASPAFLNRCRNLVLRMFGHALFFSHDVDTFLRGETSECRTQVLRFCKENVFYNGVKHDVYNCFRKSRMQRVGPL